MTFCLHRLMVMHAVQYEGPEMCHSEQLTNQHLAVTVKTRHQLNACPQGHEGRPVRTQKVVIAFFAVNHVAQRR